MSTIAEHALNFDLSGTNARFFDPPARLFSILDFKNSDDTNRWGDTSEDIDTARCALLTTAFRDSQTWKHLVQHGVIEQLCKAIVEFPSDGKSIVWGTGILMPIVVFDTSLCTGGISSPTGKIIVETLKRYWRPVTQKIWKEPSLLFSLEEDPFTFSMRTALPSTFLCLTEDAGFIASMLDVEDDVTLSLFTKIWWHCTGELDTYCLMKALDWFLSMPATLLSNPATRNQETCLSVTRKVLSRIVRGLHPASVSECSQFLSRILDIKGSRCEKIRKILMSFTGYICNGVAFYISHSEGWICPVSPTLHGPHPDILKPGNLTWPQPSSYPPDPRDRFYRSSLPLNERATHCAFFRAMVLTEPFWSQHFMIVRGMVEKEGPTSKRCLDVFRNAMFNSYPEYEGADLVRLVTAWLNAGLFDTLDALYPIIKTQEAQVIVHLFRALQLTLKAKSLPRSQRQGLSIPTKPPPAHLLRSALDFDINTSKDLSRSKPGLGETFQIKLPRTGFPPGLTNHTGRRRWLWVALYILQAKKASACRRHGCPDGGRLRCKACKTRYCGVACQRLDWRDHRLICGLHVMVDGVDVDENSPLSNPAYRATTLTVTYPSREVKK